MTALVNTEPAPTLEEVWRLFKETDRRFKETERTLKESFQETERRFQEKCYFLVPTLLRGNAYGSLMTFQQTELTHFPLPAL